MEFIWGIKGKRKFQTEHLFELEMMIENELIKNLEKIHTTEMGIDRIKRNLTLECDDVVEWCKNQIKLAGMNLKFMMNGL